VSQPTTLTRGAGPHIYGKLIQLPCFLVPYTEFAKKLNICSIAGVKFSINVSIMETGLVYPIFVIYEKLLANLEIHVFHITHLFAMVNKLLT
jgi:hypothetical protein